MNPEKASPDMTNTWHKITSLPAGGAISGISSGPGAASLWLCSPAGIFSKKDNLFTHHMRGLPFSSASAVLCAGKTILAAGYPNHIVRSADSGRTWFSCWADGISAPVTCFAASTNFSRNATILAGSDGDGILRSTDGGNSWQLANFGLRSFNVLDIAWAPALEPEPAPNAVPFNYEIVFAATEDGVYQSPNGGRAWRFAGEGIPPVPVLSIAVSPNFKKDSDAVFAGTDGAGLYRSLDGGKSWKSITPFPTDGATWAQATINTLYFNSQGILYAGTSEQGILTSPDLGETWQSLLHIDDVILRLAGHGSQLLAGTAEHGLLVSNDDGATWQIAEGLSARRVTQMAGISLSQAGDSFLVAGYAEGAWANNPALEVAAGEWRRVSGLGSTDQPVITLYAAQNRFLALTPNYLLAAQDPEQTWEKLYASSTQLSTLACSGEEIYLGSPSGDIRHSPDGGKTWEKLSPPWGKARVLDLQLRRGSAKSHTIYAVTRIDGEGITTVWCAESMSTDWKPLLQERTNWQTASLALLHPVGGNPSDKDILLAAGTELFVAEQHGWRRQSITKADAPVIALLSLEEQNIVLLAKADRLLLSRDGGATWEDAGLQGNTITALSRMPGQPCKVLALTSNGAIFGREF